MNAKILVFAGSLRQDAYSKKLARAAARMVSAAGAEASFIDLRDYSMALYDGDVEASDGPPENAFRLQELIAAQDGLIIVSPEYNHSMPALLKNTLDWVSRTPRVRGANPFKGKVAALMSTSPGGLGGIQGLDHLRRVVEVVGALVLPGTVALPHADQAFADDGNLQDERTAGRVSDLVSELVATARRLRG
jgi:NAD(P)H-dependent FMN reductase